VSELLQRERGRLDSLAAALLEHETLDQDDAYAAAGVTPARPADGIKAAAAAARVATDGG
jgi:hypothetical protein